MEKGHFRFQEKGQFVSLVAKPKILSSKISANKYQKKMENSGAMRPRTPDAFDGKRYFLTVNAWLYKIEQYDTYGTNIDPGYFHDGLDTDFRRDNLFDGDCCYFEIHVSTGTDHTSSVGLCQEFCAELICFRILRSPV